LGQLGKRPRHPAQPGCRAILRGPEPVDDVDDALGDFLGPQDLTVDLEARTLDGELVRPRIAVADECGDLLLQLADVDPGFVQKSEAIWPTRVARSPPRE
jgi:hypothetical protein